MWYYIKDNKTKGPVADSAMLTMLKSGEIDRNTLVRTGNGKAWKRFKMTRFFGRLGRKRSMHAEAMMLRTRVFRAFLIAFFIIVASSITLGVIRWNDLSAILDNHTFSVIKLRIMRADYYTYAKLLNGTMFVVLLMLVYAAMRWIKNITFNAKMLDKQFEFSPVFAAWSLIFPLINLIHPFIVISTVYKSAKGVIGLRYTIVDASIIFLWWFFTVFSLLVLIMDKWLFTVSMTLDRAKSILIFNMYAVGMFLAAISLWILLVSRIYKYQRTAFSMDI